jgi:hypothetical protein
MPACPVSCPNCEAPLAEPLPKFCPECGQETRVRAPTLGEFLQQFGGAYLSTEGALWRTLKLLLLKPGELTRQYLAGRRKHYVLPLRLYLTISVVVLLVMRVLTQIGLDEPVAVKVDAGDLSSIVVDLGTSRAGMKDGRFFCENMPGWLCKRIQRRIDVAPQAFAREALAIGERFVANLGAAMFVLLPAFAALMKLAYLGRGLRYTEHLVFALHLHAFWFLCLLLTLLPFEWMPVVAILLVPWYGLAALKRVYGGRWFWRWCRAALVSLVYAVALSFVLVFAILWSLLF